MNKTKVAVIEPVGGHCGMDYYDFALCRGLHEAGVDVSLYTCDKTITPDDTPFHVCLFFRGIYGSNPGWIRGLRYVRGAWQSVLHAYKTDSKICHFHIFHASPFDYFTILLTKAFRMQVVITAHDVQSFEAHKHHASLKGNPLNWLKKIPLSLPVASLNQRVYGCADLIIVHNQFSQCELEKNLGISANRISIVPSGNYLYEAEDKLDQKEARQALGINPDSRVLLFFGQIKQEKGLDILLRALVRVREEVPDVLLIIAGKVWKGDFGYYQGIIDELLLSENCMVHNRFIPNEDVSAYYSAADLVVLPYRKIYQSAVLLMAMSYGRPVLVSDLTGMAEVISDGDTGFLFRSGDSKDLANRLIDVLQDMETLTQVACRGQKYLEEHYRWDDVGRKTADLYHSIVLCLKS